MIFDPDALLAALPRREIKPLAGVKFRKSTIRRETDSSLGKDGEYNGFSGRERDRTADVSKKLIAAGATIRHANCDICGAAADHEHAEDYYGLTRWIGMCARCHVHTLHKRFTNPRKWSALLDLHELPEVHWARLVASEPFDLAQLLRDRGMREPTISDFAR
jgi:hypothetical protein